MIDFLSKFVLYLPLIQNKSIGSMCETRVACWTHLVRACSNEIVMSRLCYQSLLLEIFSLCFNRDVLKRCFNRDVLIKSMDNFQIAQWTILVKPNGQLIKSPMDNLKPNGQFFDKVWHFVSFLSPMDNSEAQWTISQSRLLISC